MCVVLSSRVIVDVIQCVSVFHNVMLFSVCLSLCDVMQLVCVCICHCLNQYVCVCVSVACRYQLNKMVVDSEAGPHRNRTVLFLGSSRGSILKFLIVPNQDNTVTSSNVFLEELEGYNPDK